MVKGSTNGKDPAVLWYFNDWQGGTMAMTRALKGAYMDLLTAQFNLGHLSEGEIKTVLGSDFGTAWPTLQKKFVQDDNGLYYNERLVFELVKRKSYTKSRRDNLNGTNVGDFPPHMGNVNEIENRRLKFVNEVGKYRAEFSEKLILDFESYWLEMNKSGTKFRFEDQKYFDFKKRLGTFLRNDKSGKYTHTTGADGTEAAYQKLLKKFENEGN